MYFWVYMPFNTIRTVICDDRFSLANWKLNLRGRHNNNWGKNSVETTRQRERKFVTISWYTEIYFERAYTDVKDKTIFGSTVLLF